MSPHRTRRIPEATVARLPVYLQLLVEQAELGIDSISSDGLAELAGVNAAKVRKDLSYLGSYGTRGVGYEVDYLVYQIRRELGLEHDVAGRDRRCRQPRPGARRVWRLQRARLPGRRDRRHRPRQARCGRRRRARSSPLRSGADRQLEGRVDRRRRHAARRRPGRRRQAGQGRRHEHPQLRPGGAVGSRRHHRAQGGSGGRIADPELPRAAPRGHQRPPVSCTPFPAMGGVV